MACINMGSSYIDTPSIYNLNDRNILCYIIKKGNPLVHMMSVHVTLANCLSIVKVVWIHSGGIGYYVQLLAIPVGF